MGFGRAGGASGAGGGHGGVQPLRRVRGAPGHAQRERAGAPVSPLARGLSPHLRRLREDAAARRLLDGGAPVRSRVHDAGDRLGASVSHGRPWGDAAALRQKGALGELVPVPRPRERPPLATPSPRGSREMNLID